MVCRLCFLRCGFLGVTTVYAYPGINVVYTPATGPLEATLTDVCCRETFRVVGLKSPE